MDFRLKKNFTYCIIGPSKVGKTVHLINLLKRQDELFESGKIENSIYCYKAWNESFNELQNGIIKTWLNEIPSEQQIQEIAEPYVNKGGTLLIIDDFGSQLTPVIPLLFSVLSHHLQITVILVLQALYNKNPMYKEIQTNSQYISIFKNERDKSQISTFARQFEPTNWKYIINVFSDITRKPFSYLFIDFTTSCPSNLRLRSNILPHEFPMTVYIPIK